MQRGLATSDVSRRTPRPIDLSNTSFFSALCATLRLSALGEKLIPISPPAPMKLGTNGTRSDHPVADAHEVQPVLT